MPCRCTPGLRTRLSYAEMSSDGKRRTIGFGLEDLQEQLLAFAERWPGSVADDRGRAFVAAAGEGRLVPPVLLAPPRPGESVEDYAGRVDVEPGSHVVLLVRAAGAAFGYWNGHELLGHKAIRKYVVRGRGKAQPTHLAKKGKSRYGSRLRLQNWQRMLVEINERLRSWWSDLGVPDRVFTSIPVRVFADLCAVDPGPPFVKRDPIVTRIPLHVHRPDHEELMRVHRLLANGRVDLP